MKALVLVISVAVLLGLATLVNADDPRNTQNTRSVVVTEGDVPLVPCGLFGLSKRELMQRMVAQGQESNATLHRIEVEQARQTEILRQIAGQISRAADNTQRAASDAARAWEALDHRASAKLRDVPEGTDRGPTIPLDQLPKVPPTTSPSLRDVPQGTDRGADLQGPILQGTTGRVYYAKRQIQPVTRQQATSNNKPATSVTGYSLRN